MKYENEEQIRKDFARIFDWYDYTQAYGYSSRDKNLRTPEWAEIFAEIGRLKESEDCRGKMTAFCKELDAKNE